MPKNIEAIILAAGMGKRMRPITNAIPKCLVEIDRKPIISHQIDALRDCGIRDITVVVGYKAKLIMPYIRYCAKRFYNPIYRTTNSIMSLWFVFNPSNISGRETIILNSDILFSRETISELIKINRSRISMVCDSVSPLTNADFKFRIKKEYFPPFIVDMGKNIVNPNAEYVGITYVPHLFALDLARYVEWMVNAEKLNVWYEMAILEMIKKGYNIEPFEVIGNWREIDEVKDLEESI